MKISHFIFCLSLSLLIKMTLQDFPFTYTIPISSNTGDAFTQDLEDGQLVSISTQNGFSWLRSDNPFKGGQDKGYVTLICATGPVAFGYSSNPRVTKDMYTQYNQVFPFLGNTLKSGGSLQTDVGQIYSPNIPGVAASTLLTQPAKPRTTYQFLISGAIPYISGM